MKVLALVGSYRKGGHTDFLVDKVLDGATKSGANTEKIFLMDLDIQYCRNCMQCWQRPELKLGKCPIEDDVAPVLRKITRADGLVLATPINYGWPTGVIKVFMERMGPLLREKGKGPGPLAKVPTPRLAPEDRPKKGVGVVTCFGSSFVPLPFGDVFPAYKFLKGMFNMPNVKDVKYVVGAWQFMDLYPPSKRPILQRKAEKAGSHLVS